MARANREESPADFQDYLRVRNQALRSIDSPEASFVRQQGLLQPQPYDLYREWVETRPAAVVANLAICLIHQANSLLDQQLRHLEAAFLQHGGLRERMTRARFHHRRAIPES